MHFFRTSVTVTFCVKGAQLLLDWNKKTKDNAKWQSHCHKNNSEVTGVTDDEALYAGKCTYELFIVSSQPTK